jgi:pSer/pThr/pTyr-binding forkhead associated (FHA) protein
VNAKLIRTDTHFAPEEIQLDRLPVVIGRSPDAGLCLADRWASRHHCSLEERDGSLLVRDLGSRNGTLINGCYATETVVMPGEKLTIGLSTFVVEY